MTSPIDQFMTPQEIQEAKAKALSPTSIPTDVALGFLAGNSEARLSPNLKQQLVNAALNVARDKQECRMAEMTQKVAVASEEFDSATNNLRALSTSKSSLERAHKRRCDKLSTLDGKVAELKRKLQKAEKDHKTISSKKRKVEEKLEAIEVAEVKTEEAKSRLALEEREFDQWKRWYQNNPFDMQIATECFCGEVLFGSEDEAVFACNGHCQPIHQKCLTRHIKTQFETRGYQDPDCPYCRGELKVKPNRDDYEQTYPVQTNLFVSDDEEDSDYDYY